MPVGGKKKIKDLDKIIPNILIVGTVTALQFITLFFTQVLLARFLSPTQFGSFALISTVIMFMHTLGNMHGDRYLIMIKKNSHDSLDNIFTAELLWSLLLILFCFLALPIIMNFLNKPGSTLYAQVYSIILLHNPLLKPRALLEKKLSFIKATLPTLLSNIIGGAFAVILVYLDYGLWSLVWWKIATYGIDSFLTWLVIPYRPKFSFDLQIFRESFKFSSPIMLAGIVAFVFSNIDYYIINFLMDAKTLGFYWLAYQSSHYLLNIRGSVNKVIYPVVSQMKDFKGQKTVFNLMTNITTVIFFGIIFFIFLFAEEAIMLTYGPKMASIGKFT